MPNRPRIDMSDLGSSSKRSDGASSPKTSSKSSSSAKSNRTKSIAMMGGLIALLSAVALVYSWPHLFPEKITQEDIGPPPDPNAPPQQPPPPPSDPSNPDSNLPPGIISG